MSRTFSKIFGLGEKIKYLRIKNGLKQKDLSLKAGISQEHLSKIEAGVNISGATLSKIANALMVDINYFIAADNQKSELVELLTFNISKKLFSSRPAVEEFNLLPDFKKKVYVFPELLEQFKGKPIYAYEMPDESLNEIIKPKDTVIVLFNDKIKPTKNHDGQILAVEFQGGVKALKLFNYDNKELEDRNIDEIESTQETYNIKNVKIIGVAVLVISYIPLIPHVV